VGVRRMAAAPLVLLESVGLMFAAFLATYAIMPWLIAALRKAEITGTDVHKQAALEIPTMGGIGVFVGFTAAMASFASTSAFDFSTSFASTGFITRRV